MDYNKIIHQQVVKYQMTGKLPKEWDVQHRRRHDGGADQPDAVDFNTPEAKALVRNLLGHLYQRLTRSQRIVLDAMLAGYATERAIAEEVGRSKTAVRHSMGKIREEFSRLTAE